MIWICHSSCSKLRVLHSTRSGCRAKIAQSKPTYLTLITNELVPFDFLFKNRNFSNSLNHTYFMYKKKKKKELNKNIVMIR